MAGKYGLLGGPLDWLGQPINQNYPDISRAQGLGFGLSDLAGHMSAMSRGQPYRPQFQQQLRRTGLVNAQKRDMLARREMQKQQMAEQQRQFGLSHGLAKDRLQETKDQFTLTHDLAKQKFKQLTGHQNWIETYQKAMLKIQQGQVLTPEERAAALALKEAQTEAQIAAAGASEARAAASIAETNRKKAAMDVLTGQAPGTSLNAGLGAGPTQARADAGLPLAGAPAQPVQGINNLPGTAGGMSPQAMQIARTEAGLTGDPDKGVARGMGYDVQRALSTEKMSDTKRLARDMYPENKSLQAEFVRLSQDKTEYGKNQLSYFLEKYPRGSTSVASPQQPQQTAQAPTFNLEGVPPGWSLETDRKIVNSIKEAANMKNKAGVAVIRNDETGDRKLHPIYGTSTKEKAATLGSYETGIKNLESVADYFGSQEEHNWDKLLSLANQGKWTEKENQAWALIEGIARGLTGAAMPKEEVATFKRLYLPSIIDRPYTRRAKMRLLSQQAFEGYNAMARGEPGTGEFKGKTAAEFRAIIEQKLAAYEAEEKAKDAGASSTPSFKILD